MADMLYGGGGLFLGYRVAVNGGAYEIQKPDGSAAATTTADAAIKVDGFIEQTQLIPASDGTMKVTLDNYDVSEAIIAFMNRFAKKTGGSSAGTAPAAIKMEHGVEKPAGGGGSNSLLLFWQSYGPLNEAGTKRLMHWGVASVDMSSGAIIYKDGQWIKPTIILNSVGAEYELDSSLAALWEAAKVNNADALLAAVAQYSHYEREYITIA